jgi:7-cyano-7-deazaguanine synthase in queuosine biosynthesis
MRIVCAPKETTGSLSYEGDLNVVLYGYADRPADASIGSAVLDTVQRHNIAPAPRAWDLLSIAMSVIAADTGVRRDESSDGWTRQLQLQIAVNDPDFWSSQGDLLARQLRFLTTDLWTLEFFDTGDLTNSPAEPTYPKEDCVSLLSGGLDSLVGTVDLVEDYGRSPYVVSQVALGDKEKQKRFASKIGSGLSHLQLNHNVSCPGQNERSQRARSMIFLAYGVLAATSLQDYADGHDVTLYVCENGFISVNPPLTGARLGSLSTRTTHPTFLRSYQQLLRNADLRVEIENPYRFKTKGEMLLGCADQQFLQRNAKNTTSCGRFARNGYRHCGRCLPCLIRRSAFYAWGVPDDSDYIYKDLSRDDENHARYDDVRSAAMAIAQARTEGWTCPVSVDTSPSRSVAFYQCSLLEFSGAQVP